MRQETGLKCVVSGSFSRFKAEIDRTIEEFRDLGVGVLAPDTGGFIKPTHHILTLGQYSFRPLMTEKGMSARQIENSFLNAIKRSDFQYIENPDGYIGNSTALEIGVTLAYGLLSFSRQLIPTSLDLDPAWKTRISKIENLDPGSVVEKMLAEKPTNWQIWKIHE